MNGHSDLVGLEESYEDMWVEVQMADNQEAEVLAWLKHYGTITQAQALTHLSIGRLASRIHTLRNRDGYDIETHSVTRKKKNGRSCTFAKYYLKNSYKERMIKENL